MSFCDFSNENLVVYLRSCGNEVNDPSWEDCIAEIERRLNTKPDWKPFEFRELDEDEKEEHPSWDYIMVNSPYDEQEILVSDGKSVWEDCFFNDGTQCYLDSNRDMEGLAWMPMPKPYRGE